MESLGLRCGKSFSFRRGLVTDEQPWTSCFPAHHHHHHQHHQQQPMKKKQKSTIKPIHMTRACAKNTIDPLVSSSSSSSSSSLNSKKWKAGKLDEWMRDSVTEIVRNIGEAPFLAHVYSPTTKETTRLELERETDSWPAITRRWEEGCPIPDGVILVEQLGQQQQQEEEATSTAAGTGTRAWGVLIQGKGVDTAACYILKTCRVWSSLGFCTHFCLVKAKCFGETAELQLQNSWNGIN